MDSRRFYPDGLDRSWADGRGASPSDKENVNDVKFLSQLIEKLAGQYSIDRRRVYVAGMSNGGFMSARLACELSDEIAAVATVGASLSVPVNNGCKPAMPVSVLIMQGTKDPVVPYEGGALGRNGEGGQILSYQETMKKWVALDQCPRPGRMEHIPDRSGDGTSIDVVSYGNCAGGTEVRSYTIVEGGHAWPGGIEYLPALLIGKTTKNLDASEVIWEFFSRHSAVTKQRTDR